jgi:hypothetical protein
MLSTTETIIMNKATSHLYCIYITSPLLKKRFGCKLFAIHFYFSSSQYYRTLDKTLAIQLSLHLICFIIRLYSFNSNHLSVIFFFFCNKCDGIVISKHHDWKKCTSKCFKDNNKASHFFFNCGYFFFIFVKRLTKIAIRQIYVIFAFLEQNFTNTCFPSIHC